MKYTTIKASAAALVPAVAMFLLVQACGGSSDSVAQAPPATTAADPIEGVWEAVVSQRDCISNAVIAIFRGAQAMHRGGTLTDTNAGAPTARGPGFGNWTRNTDGTYTAKFRFYRFNPDGTLAGTNVVSTTRTLVDPNTYTGVTRNEVRDVSGNVLQTICVTDLGTRFN